ncbi:hypothetical protein DMN91_009143 [Ooceraea biroi]|uniref:NADPH--hemoprotein reductase n=1 Tax=Ooceraea biroi TaxID=2015173 RepID=A0A3L8DER8_OOCBI|nr:hypothetical protein DMN91_009143 [Ooceraea biroi]
MERRMAEDWRGDLTGLNYAQKEQLVPRVFELGLGTTMPTSFLIGVTCRPHDAKNPFWRHYRTASYTARRPTDHACISSSMIEDSKMRYERAIIIVHSCEHEELVNKIGEQCGANLIPFSRHKYGCYRTALTTSTSRAIQDTFSRSYPSTRPTPRQGEIEADGVEHRRGQGAYQQWIVQQNRTIVHILKISRAKAAVDHLRTLPRLQCRYYSISSSPKACITYASSSFILIRIIKWFSLVDCWSSKRMTSISASSQLDSRHGGSEEVPVPFADPPTHTHHRGRSGNWPAPFRVPDLQERITRERRRSNEDYLYRGELEEYVKSGTLILHTAFSREQSHKVYVTHLLEQNKEELWRVIGEQNGHIYVWRRPNSLLIDCWLKSRSSSAVSRVFTNPAWYDGNGMLRVSMYHTQRSCQAESANLCKGQVLTDYVKERRDQDYALIDILDKPPPDRKMKAQVAKPWGECWQRP